MLVRVFIVAASGAKSTTMAMIRHRTALYGFLALPFLAVGAAVFMLGPWQYERDLDCSGADTPRAAAICQSLAAHLEFSLLGHAIISPGYKVSNNTIAMAYCETHITQDDATTLKALASSNDWRLQSGAGNLYDIVTRRASDGSIMHPDHPNFVLKPGCEAILSH